ncbi:hypothetical protein GMRT_11665 [Giardia muris]|uniref:Uncharacterized protein n=1 Tax=Giardia muris TaxID=5742 RepID=A0A4Z1TAK0_GIAMU|nr:hypothetical protein GMRT_11665 [Giardia muris]|eukprot:TNJ29541.1 hypothetical protein GMRT_11665 [Giardia muris]
MALDPSFLTEDVFHPEEFLLPRYEYDCTHMSLKQLTRLNSGRRPSFIVHSSLIVQDDDLDNDPALDSSSICEVDGGSVVAPPHDSTGVWRSVIPRDEDPVAVDDLINTDNTSILDDSSNLWGNEGEEDYTELSPDCALTLSDLATAPRALLNALSPPPDETPCHFDIRTTSPSFVEKASYQHPESILVVSTRSTATVEDDSSDSPPPPVTGRGAIPLEFYAPVVRKALKSGLWRRPAGVSIPTEPHLTLPSLNPPVRRNVGSRTGPLGIHMHKVPRLRPQPYAKCVPTPPLLVTCLPILPSLRPIKPRGVK